MSRKREGVSIDYNTDVPYRFADFAVMKPSCSASVFPPDCPPVSVEIKPDHRSNANREETMRGGIQQSVAHQAKFLSACLNFSGCGTNGHSTGVVGTLAYLQVIRVEMTGVGTEKCCLQLYGSDLFPLLTRANFEKWITSNSNEGAGDHNALVQRLYPAGDDIGCPLGFKLLYQILTSKSKDLFGQFWVDSPGNDVDFHSLIGLGGFSCVFMNRDRTCVTKISRVGRITNIRNEIEALKIIGPNSSRDSLDGLTGRNSLPDLVSYGYKKVSVGLTHRKLPYLQLSPVAHPLGRYLNLENTRDAARELMKLAVELCSAIAFCHSKGISHNDLSPENVLLIHQSDGEFRGLLSDFSVATKLRTEQIDGFIGNPNFAHPDPHKEISWVADDYHDYDSVGLVLAYLCPTDRENPDDLVWHGGVGSFIKGEGAKARLEIATNRVTAFCGTYDCNEFSEELINKYNYLRSETENAVPPPNVEMGLQNHLLHLLQNDNKSVFTTKCGCAGDCDTRRCSCKGQCDLLCSCSGNCEAKARIEQERSKQVETPRIDFQNPPENPYDNDGVNIQVSEDSSHTSVTYKPEDNLKSIKD